MQHNKKYEILVILYGARYEIWRSLLGTTILFGKVIIITPTTYFASKNIDTLSSVTGST